MRALAKSTPRDKVIPPAAPDIPAPSAPASASVASLHPLTDARKRIFDAQDILGGIYQARKNGTQDEKEWAAYLLVSCTHLFAKLAQPDPSDAALEQGRTASSPDNSEIAAQKKLASEILADRCKGVSRLSVEDRTSLRDDLLRGSSKNQSALGQLHGISDDRWSGQQANVITESLYSQDPILARAAFTALLSAFDSASPGGLDRQRAFTQALGPVYLNFPLSDYERLQGCRSMGWCGSTWGPQEDTSESSPAVQRLVDEYRQAIDSREDARQILAIR